jgi:hypothetical protein
MEFVMTILITPSGDVFTFYIAELAKEYQYAYGGVIVEEITSEKERSENDDSASVCFQNYLV